MNTIVFICHDDASIKRVIDHNFQILFVGNRQISAEYATNKNIHICRNMPNNIEHEPTLLTFTAWYAIIKNNLFTQSSYITLLEYDTSFSPNFLENLNNLCKRGYDVISFFNDKIQQWFLCDIDIFVLSNFLRLKGFQKNFTQIHWSPTTNHCIRREILEGFVDWYFPAYLYIKKYDSAHLSWYHERLFPLYLESKNIGYYELEGLHHQVLNSHSHMKPHINPKKYFLVYDDGKYRDNLVRLLNSVQLYSDYIIICMTKEDIDPNFYNSNIKIFNESRGGGYWLWKPYIINKVLSQIKEGDLLFYLDSSYYFTEAFNGLYESAMETTDIMLWKNKPNESTNLMHKYCKMDVLIKYGMVEYSEVECWAGAILMRKTNNISIFMKEWLRMCCVYEDISDFPSIFPNYPDFSEHRHDQSLLTILAYKNMIKLFDFDRKYLQNVRIPWN